MSKLKFLLLLSLVVTAACGGQAPAATTPAKTAAPPAANTAVPPTATQAPTSVAATSTSAAAAPTQPAGGLSLTPATSAAAPKLDPAGMCKAAGSPKPVPDFPATLPTDQVKGQANAPASLYEYSDFQ